ncbi:MAG: NUDIX hydrolase [Candidatus Omnitrophota bacterium]
MPRKKLDFRPHQKVVLPNGKTIHISFIHHPGAVIIAPFLNPNTIVMLRQFRPALGRYIYELPAGTIDVPEKPLVCARRELLEETGFSARKFKKLGSIYPVPGYSTEVIHIFKAEELTQEGANPEEYEVIDIKEVTKKEVKRLFQQGKLMDAKSICTFAHLGWL